MKYNDKENNIFIESQRMIYNEIENTILSKNETFVNLENKYDVVSSDILFNRKMNSSTINLDHVG